MNTRIAGVHARQILDSRGRPTVEADVTLDNGIVGRASAPSGASTGRYEAVELRDGNPAQFGGLGVGGAVANANRLIADAIMGQDACDQKGLDRTMIALDGTPQLAKLGANATLAVSLAASRAAAAALGLPLHRYVNSLLRETGAPMSMPMPMVNILSGGAHASRSMDIQDFLMIPIGAETYGEALEMISQVRSAAADLMAASGMPTLLADEGGLSPGFATVDEGLELMMRSFEAAGLKPGEQVAIALDVAASELLVDGRYSFNGGRKRLDGEEMLALFDGMVRAFPVVSIEDALDQDDWTGWATMTRALAGRNVQLVGDDLFATNVGRIERGIDAGVCNAVLIKLNQNGTLSGSLEAMQTAWAAGYATVVSARSGETEDNYIADLAVGAGAGQIKIGSLRNSERLAKYNQLSRLQEDGEIGALARLPVFAGRAAQAKPVGVGT